jgi:hypothetical protein
MRDLADTFLENHEIAMECAGEIENLFDLRLASAVSEITRKKIDNRSTERKAGSSRPRLSTH